MIEREKEVHIERYHCIWCKYSEVPETNYIWVYAIVNASPNSITAKK